MARRDARGAVLVSSRLRAAPGRHRVPTWPAVALCGLAAAAASLAACGGGDKVVTIVAHEPAAQARLQFGVFALGQGVDAARVEAERRGWTASEGAWAADGKVVLQVPAGDEIERYDLQAERGKIIQILLTYRQEDPARVDLRHSYAASRVQPDGAWAMTDNHRQTLVLIRARGRELLAMHLDGMADKEGVKAVLHRTLGE